MFQDLLFETLTCVRVRVEILTFDRMRYPSSEYEKPALAG